MDRILRAMRRNAATSVGLLLFVVLSLQADAADKVRIQQAVDRGVEFLFRQNKTTATGSLACYSLVKAGVDKEHPDIQKCVQEVLAKCRGTNYLPAAHHNYEAGVDAMLLEAVDRDVHRPQLEMIAKYLIARQRPHGGWFYPTEQGGGGDFGDTSITQYAVLGLWAAARADVEVPIETWERVARWLLATQGRDGGFSYHPMDRGGAGNAGVNSSGTMTVAGTGSLLIVRHVLFRDAAFAVDEDRTGSSPATRRFGVLERLPEDKEQNVKAKAKGNPTMTAAAFDKALKEGVRWTGERFADQGSLASYGNYYFYGIERVGALLGVEKLGTHDWYNEGSDALLRMQAPDGSWNDSCGQVPATALTLLFLTKATAGAIQKPPTKRIPLVGGGLLVGGRGLPGDLNAIKVQDGDVSTRKPRGSVDELLAELEKSSDAKVEAIQEAVVESVQLDQPELLIGQVDRLKRLATDKRTEVRRTAMWALGRTGIVSVAPLLIQGLSDADEAVAREASIALCILSRRPDGIGPTTDPADGLADDASNEQRAAHLDNWSKQSSNGWTEWYLKVRPYDERDDRTLLKRSP